MKPAQTADSQGNGGVMDQHSRDDRSGELSRRLGDKTATIAVLGMGYVGIPLAHAVLQAGYPTIGLDTDPWRVDALQRGDPYIGHLDEQVFGRLAASDSFFVTTDLRALGQADAVLVCVPTPLDASHAPDLGAIKQAAGDIATFGRPDQLVVLESTTYPGTTREILLPALASADVDPESPGSRSPLIAYSPERLDPGGPSEFESVPKLVAGLDDQSLRLAVTLYENVVGEVRPVSSLETAEAAKLLENTFRAVNIALVNELKVALTPLGIDIWDVIAAASSKPFGFMPFYPGPGVGGHCIPVDPTYLAWRSRGRDAPLALTETAIRINTAMPRYVIGRLSRALEDQNRVMAEAAVLVVGVSYKPDISDVRGSPGVEILHQLHRLGARVGYHDPHVPHLESGSIRLDSSPWEPSSVAAFDAAIVCTDHAAVDLSLLADAPLVIVDTRNAMERRGLVGRAPIVKA